MAATQTAPKPALSTVLRDAGKKALGGGLAGGLAMVVQVLALMWMRTTINFQHKYGMSTSEAMAQLYAQGGIARFYQGLGPALLQAPLSRFGDTASNAGMQALLETVNVSPIFKTLAASLAAAAFRMFLMPLDAIKTTMQTDGAKGMTLLADKIAAEGFTTLFSGGLAASFATLVGHYPWFLTYNFLQARVPKADGFVAKQFRSAIVGFAASFTSDVSSNSVRVVKTAKQTSATGASYATVINSIVSSDGLSGLFLRGLSTKIISNGVQAMLFTIVWRYLQDLLERREAARRKTQ